MIASLWNKWTVSGVAMALGASVALAADGGSIKGKVSFEGTLPKGRPPMKDIADAHCKKQHPNGIEMQTVKVKDGALADVFVQIKSGLPKDQKFEVPKEPVVLSQKGCEYHPHIFGVMVGQGVEVINEDPTNHNIHGFARKNAQFNFSQAQKGMKKTVDLTKLEDFRIACDVHSWMNAHAFVLSHPFYAVSDAEGNFEIKNVPPGTYEIEFWHETLGTKTTKSVKVEAGKPVTVDSKFEPKKTGAAPTATKKPASK